ncbi:unnamed protein product [Callosobruchus maculatus]|uniref:C2H2-type domain-containing protein n=1 Tax=Callosobruchus maculatus TaxID=64391 RepID=A0A653DMG2_CALMS|nr:unnamed protein product [Callosobruchus maculatus]
MANFWDGKPICRICLKVLGSSGYSYVNEDNIKEMILYSVPEVDIYTSADPVICLMCHNMLVNVYNFKKKCINTEVILRTYRTRHHIDEDGEVELPKLVEELVRFNSYFNQQQYNKSLSMPFPPPQEIVVSQTEKTCGENAIESDKNNQNVETLVSPISTEFDKPHIIDPNVLSRELPPQQQSAPSQMALPQFYETQFDTSLGSLSHDHTTIPPNVPNIPENISESNQQLLQNFPMHFMAPNASSQLVHLNRHHMVNSNHNHLMHQPSFGPHVPTQQFINHNQFVHMPHPQLVNGNQGAFNMPVHFINPNSTMQNVVPLVVTQKLGNGPMETFRYVQPSSFNPPLYHPRGGNHPRPTMNVNDFAKNVVVKPPSVPKAPPRPREKTTEQRPTDGMKVLKVVLKRKLETHPIESKRRLVVKLERCPLIPSNNQNEDDRSPETNQKLFQCVGCMYMTTSSKFFTEHLKKCANAPKESDNDIELKCTKCPYVTCNQMDLREHVQSLHTPPKELLSCKSCRFVTMDEVLLKRHESEDRVKCPKCTHLFCSEENLQKHMERHEKNSCPFCAYSPADRSNLRRHIFAHSPVQIPCEFCDYRHSSPHVLRSHLKKYHNSVGIEDLDYKPNMSMEELIQDIKALIEATK